MIIHLFLNWGKVCSELFNICFSTSPTGGSKNCARLSISYCDREKVEVGVIRFCNALKEMMDSWKSTFTYMNIYWTYRRQIQQWETYWIQLKLFNVNVSHRIWNNFKIWQNPIFRTSNCEKMQTADMWPLPLSTQRKQIYFQRKVF